MDKANGVCLIHSIGRHQCRLRKKKKAAADDEDSIGYWVERAGMFVQGE